MRIISQLFHILYMAVILIFLVYCATVYFELNLVWLHQFAVEVEGELLKLHAKTGIMITPRLGFVIALVLLALPVAISRFSKNTSEKPALESIPVVFTFVMPIILVFAIGIIAGIYYWPENVITIGKLSWERGTREEFVEMLLHWGTTLLAICLVAYNIKKLYVLITCFDIKGEKKKEKNKQQTVEE